MTDISVYQIKKIYIKKKIKEIQKLFVSLQAKKKKYISRNFLSGRLEKIFD